MVVCKNNNKKALFTHCLTTYRENYYMKQILFPPVRSTENKQIPEESRVFLLCHLQHIYTHQQNPESVEYN